MTTKHLLDGVAVAFSLMVAGLCASAATTALAIGNELSIEQQRLILGTQTGGQQCAIVNTQTDLLACLGGGAACEGPNLTCRTDCNAVTIQIPSGLGTGPNQLNGWTQLNPNCGGMGSTYTVNQCVGTNCSGPVISGPWRCSHLNEPAYVHNCNSPPLLDW